MKNTQIEFENLGKHLDESFSNINCQSNADGDDLSGADGDEYSNAGGRRGGGGGIRMGGVGGFRGSFQGSTPRQHTNYVRRNYNRYGWGWYGYPYSMSAYPPVAYYYDAENPKTIKITKAGLQYLKKAKGVHAYFLNAIKDGNSINETNLKDSLQLKDFERVMSWMYGNKFIDFV